MCPCSDFMDMLWHFINCCIIIIVIIIIIIIKQLVNNTADLIDNS